MIKRFIKDNRGQVLYAVIVAIMFIGLLSMTAMGLTLKNYQASLQKQQRVSDYYAADAVAELIRIEKIQFEEGETELYLNADYTKVNREDPYAVFVTKEGNVYTIRTDTATIKAEIDTGDHKFHSWEVSYHAVQTQAETEQDPAS